MAAILAKLVDGELSYEDIFDTVQSVENKDIKIKNGKQRLDNLTELSPFLINYLREKTAHHLTPRQTAVFSPKKTPVCQERTKKNAVSTSKETPHHAIKNSSRGNLFPLHKMPTPSPVTPLSQSRRERLQERQASPNSSPHLRRKSPKTQGYRGSGGSPLVIQKKLNIDDPEDFPPVGAQVTPENKKVTPSRRITPIPIQSDGNKGKTSTPFSSSPCVESHESSMSLQEERSMLKLIKSKKKNKEDPHLGDRMSPSPHVGVRSPPLVLGDFIVSPNSRSHSPKNSAMTDAWQHGHTDINESTWSTTTTCKDFIENNSPLASSSNGLKVTHSLGSIKSTAQALQVKKDKIIFQDKIDVLARLYSNCITENLVPNLTAELYFVVQLLTARGIPSQLKDEQGHDNNMADQNVLDSIHNCVYFAVEVLHNIQSLILLLDKETLHLLADNPRIAEFSPSLKDTFLKQSKTSASPVKVSDLKNIIKSPLGGVPFSVERDNRQNFPTDRAFHNFRKQRDVFYELVREWEDCHSRAGWNMEDYMGDRIRALVNQKPEVANYSHFARLFKSQLIQMCEEERSDFHTSHSFCNLQKSNPEKFQRLQERFVTPLSSLGPCPPPSFTNVQEFFKRFIFCAASPSFNQHLMDLLIVTVTELNDTEFPLAEIKEGIEKDVSLQHQELKQDFASCLMKIRVFAKFLGLLTFQPYYGSDSSSQPVVKTALQIRNKIPAQFDILRYLKNAWYKKRLVMTIPWAVQYLSMMDPLGPLLDYFAEVLQWLLRTYRQMAPMQHVDYSSFLLVSCLGWLFEIPVIPASFFFKTSTELKHTDDGDDNATKELDQQVNLDTSGLVDQDILYSCCPYLGEIRLVLVEAAAGFTSRAGPVKKITPICADEPARISSSQKQLQLQLEESFFRIQPDYLKRLSDFTLERLSSNVISHIKGHIVPSLLENGVQRIQTFLESEFSSNGNSDQAKEKCRPSILKIIHSVTDDAVKTALEVVETCRTKCVTSFESLCPKEMNPKVIMTASKITSRLIKEKTTDWINTSLPNIMEEELFAQFNKIVNSILYVKSTEGREKLGNDPKQDDCSAKSSKLSSERNSTETITSLCKERKSAVILQIKALQSALSEQSKLLATQSSNGISLETVEAITTVENNVRNEGEKQWRVKDLMLVGQITVELAFILVCRTAHNVTFCAPNSTEGDSGILETLLRLWSRLKERHAPAPFQYLLRDPHVQLIARTDNRQVIWEAVQQFCLALIENRLACIDEVEQWYLGAFSSCTDEASAVEVGKACCYLVSAHYETKVKGDGTHNSPNSADLCLLLSTLRQRFADNASIISLLRKSVQIIPGVIVIVDDSSEPESPRS